ncbi:MAG TPA: trypsin-like peptidase domain-containing protein [Casimicrobiaceae bacterium]|jgi:hypothetical protein|nr:trypsin-like peptidase domain-containing protein [Casimicrobiaceae bacterium]
MQEPTFKESGPEQLIHEIAMPLIAVAQDGNQEYVSGTAFVIGRGWALTAFHVLDDFVLRYEGVRVGDGNPNISFQILAFLTVEAGKKVLPLRVMRIWRATPLDIAVLAFGVDNDWPDDYVWKVPALDLLPPKCGTPIFGFGFANPSLDRPGNAGPPLLNLHPRTTTGHVIEIHHELRDTSRLPFPCFRSNARFDGGMSGGPVFNKASGKLCGVICSSLPGTNPDEEHVSYVSSLWPIIATPIDATDTEVSGAARYPLMRLFENRILNATNLERVGLTLDSERRTIPFAHYNRAEWDGGGPTS